MRLHTTIASLRAPLTKRVQRRQPTFTSVIYSISTQDFRTLRGRGMHYVDKTEQICRIASLGRYLFLSRPRRFGKSLTVSTLNELYCGSTDLFHGLWAGEHWNFPERERPVIWLQFASSTFQVVGLIAAIDLQLSKQAAKLGVHVPESENYALRFQQLIEGAAANHQSGKVVVLIDEYDKPILEYLDDLPRATVNRDVLKAFYGILKDADPYIELVFITGVSAFSKVSLFSELNNLLNLTLHPLAYTLVGLTQTELEANFGPQLDATGISRDEVRHWYNGYAWGEHERVYNPWSILQFLQSGLIQNYWASSGTPMFVTKLMAQSADYEITALEVDETQLTSFNIEQLSPISILFQAGYLTVKRVDRDVHLYELDYPNEEVRRTFQLALLGQYGFGTLETPIARVLRLRKAFAERDLNTVIDIINASLAAVPYQLWAKQSEAMVHAILHTTFTVLGVYTRSEVSTARGRADIVVEVPKYIYVIELKLVRDSGAGASLTSAAEALAQIEARGYAKPYIDDGREIIRVGIAFDVEARAVSEWAEA